MEKRPTYGLSLIVLLMSAPAPSVAGAGTASEEHDPELLLSPWRISEDVPCSSCHRYQPIDRKKRPLVLLHAEIVLDHAGPKQWCYDCHQGDALHLSDGTVIDFEKSGVLCGQCHGTTLRDWRAGIHGRRTGRWDGEKLYRQCVSCHDPHRPAFKALVPMAPPKRPDEITPTGKR